MRSINLVPVQDPIALSAHYDEKVRCVVIKLNSGIEFGFRPHSVQGLEASMPDDLRHITILDDGLNVGFPSLSAKFHVPTLIDEVWSRHSHPGI